MSSPEDFVRTIKENVASSETQVPDVFSQLVEYTKVPNLNSSVQTGQHIAGYENFLTAMILLFSEDISNDANAQKKYKKLFKGISCAAVDALSKSTQEINLASVGPAAALAVFDQKKVNNSVFGLLCATVDACFEYDAEWNGFVTCRYILAQCASEASAAPYVFTYFLATKKQPRKLCFVLHDIGVELVRSGPNFVLENLAEGNFANIEKLPSSTAAHSVLNGFLTLIVPAFNLCTADFVAVLWDNFCKFADKPKHAHVELPHTHEDTPLVLHADNAIVGYIYTLLIYVPLLLEKLIETEQYGEIKSLPGLARILALFYRENLPNTRIAGGKAAESVAKEEYAADESNGESIEEGELGSDVRKYVSVTLLTGNLTPVPICVLFKPFISYLVLYRPAAVASIAVLLETIARHDINVSIERQLPEATLQFICRGAISEILVVLQAAKLSFLGVSITKEYAQRQFNIADLSFDRRLLQQIDFRSYLAAYQQNSRSCYKQVLQLILGTSRATQSAIFSKMVRFVWFDRAHKCSKLAPGELESLQEDIGYLLLHLPSDSLLWEWTWVHDMADIVQSFGFFVNSTRIALSQLSSDTEAVPTDQINCLLHNLRCVLKSSRFRLTSRDFAGDAKCCLSFSLDDVASLVKLFDAAVSQRRHTEMEEAAEHIVPIMVEHALSAACRDSSLNLEAVMPAVYIIFSALTEYFLRVCSDSGPVRHYILVNSMAAWSAGRSWGRYFSSKQFQGVAERVFTRLVTYSIAGSDCSMARKRSALSQETQSNIVLCFKQLLAALSFGNKVSEDECKRSLSPESWLGDIISEELNLRAEPTPTLLYDYFFPQVVWYSRQLDYTQKTFCWPYDLELWFKFEQSPILWELFGLVLAQADIGANSLMNRIVQSLLASLVAFWCHFSHNDNPRKFPKVFAWTKLFVSSLLQRLLICPWAITFLSSMDNLDECQRWDGRPELQAVSALFDIAKGSEISVLLERIVWPILQQMVLDHTEWASEKKSIVDSTDGLDPRVLLATASQLSASEYKKLQGKQKSIKKKRAIKREKDLLSTLFGKGEAAGAVPGSSAIVASSLPQVAALGFKMVRQAPDDMGQQRSEMRKLLESMIKKDLDTFAQFQWCLQIM